jgi:DNA-directed RNA polymerase subunit RPC12/RpoP
MKSADILLYRPRPVKGTVKRCAENRRYSCRQCSGEKFYLQDDAGVTCEGCGFFICNLEVKRVF